MLVMPHLKNVETVQACSDVLSNVVTPEQAETQMVRLQVRCLPFSFFLLEKKNQSSDFFFSFFFSSFFFLFFFPSLSQPIKEIARGEVTDASEIIVTIDMVAKLSSVETNAAMLQESGVASSLVSTIAATASQVRI